MTQPDGDDRIEKNVEKAIIFYPARLLDKVFKQSLLLVNLGIVAQNLDYGVVGSTA